MAEAAVSPRDAAGDFREAGAARHALIACFRAAKPLKLGARVAPSPFQVGCKIYGALCGSLINAVPLDDSRAGHIRSTATAQYCGSSESSVSRPPFCPTVHIERYSTDTGQKRLQGDRKIFGTYLRRPSLTAWPPAFASRRKLECKKLDTATRQEQENTAPYSSITKSSRNVCSPTREQQWADARLRMRRQWHEIAFTLSRTRHAVAVL